MKFVTKKEVIILSVLVTTAFAAETQAQPTPQVTPPAPAVRQYEPRQGPGDLHIEAGGTVETGSVSTAAGSTPFVGVMGRASIEGEPFRSLDETPGSARQRMTLGAGLSSHNARFLLQYGNTVAIGRGPRQLVLGTDRALEMTNTVIIGDILPAGVRFRNQHGHLDLQGSPLVMGSIRDQGGALYGLGARVGGEVHPTRALTLYGDVAAVVYYAGSGGRRRSQNCVSRPALATDTDSTTAHQTQRVVNNVTTVCTQENPRLELTGAGYSVRGRVGARYQFNRDLAGYAEIVGEAAGARAVAINMDGSSAGTDNAAVSSLAGQVGIVYTYDESGESARRMAAERAQRESARAE